VEFGHPHWLWGLAALPLFAFWMAWGGRRSRADLTAFTGAQLQSSLAPGYSWRKNLLKGSLRILGLALVLVALAAPRFGSQLVKVEREGIDLVIALDTSLSMMAEDMSPNRLEHAKREMVDLIKGLRGDRVGLVVFAGDAFVLCPLTVDYDAALMFTRSVDVYVVSEPGTAIDKAIETSVALFDDTADRDRAIILVTDGESHEGDIDRATALASERGVRVFTIGIGNPKGELIPERGSDGSIAGYKKDKRGQTVLTQLDEVTLQRIAAATDGMYLPATREGLELKVLYSEIEGMNRTTIKGDFVERKKERFWIFLVFGGLFLLLETVMTTRATGSGRRRLLHTGVSAVFSLTVGLIGLITMSIGLVPVDSVAKSVKRTQVDSGNKYFLSSEYDKALTLYREALGDTLSLPDNYQGVLYNQGNALYMQEKYKEAIEFYQRSFSDDSTLTGQMLYNRGNALMQSGEFAVAVESYVQALQYMPDDEAARHNLEVALRALENQQEQQQEQDQDQQGDNDEDSDQEQNQDQQQQNQNQQQQQDGDQQDNQEEQPDSTQQQPQPDSSQTQQPDTSQVPTPQLSPEDMMRLSPEDAMRILQTLEEEENRLQKERRRAAFRRLKRSGKDW